MEGGPHVRAQLRSDLQLHASPKIADGEPSANEWAHVGHVGAEYISTADMIASKSTRCDT